MLDVSYLVSLLFSPTLFTWFSFKNVLLSFLLFLYIMKLYVFVMVNMKMEVERNYEYVESVLTGKEKSADAVVFGFLVTNYTCLYILS